MTPAFQSPMHDYRLHRLSTVIALQSCAYHNRDYGYRYDIYRINQ